jgi:hypothetical protein
MDAKAFRSYVRGFMRLILLLSALLSAIAGYTPAVAARPVQSGHVLSVSQSEQAAQTARPANTATPAAPLALVATVRKSAVPLYADRMLI